MGAPHQRIGKGREMDNIRVGVNGYGVIGKRVADAVRIMSAIGAAGGGSGAPRPAPRPSMPPAKATGPLATRASS